MPDRERRLAPLTPVATSCSAGQCPTVYASTDSGSLVVQGYAVSAELAGIDVPDGEMLVEIPLELLAAAARKLS